MRPNDRDRLGATDHALLVAENARLEAAKMTYAIVERGIASRYGLQDGDKVDLETGRITRVGVTSLPERRAAVGRAGR